MTSFAVPDVDIPLQSVTLDNGLRVTVSEDHTAPIVAINLWYHVGSANERAGRTGFAHLFEHMLFQGSEHVAANEHFELVQRAGGTLNGSTWLDRTNYFETVPSNQLELALWLEADRMGNLLPAMTKEKLDTQRDVVKNERRWTVDNQPYGTWWERLPALAFPPDHPFHHSLIGSMEDLDAASLEDVAEFFRTYYVPRNATLSIAGDVTAREAVSLAQKHFGKIAPGDEPPPVSSMAVPQTFGRWIRATVPDRVAVPRLFLAFRSPVFGSERYYASSLACSAIGQQMGSRLYRSLVRGQRIASAASAFTFDLTTGSDLLVADVTARPGVSPVQLEAAVVAEIDAVMTEGFESRELDRALALVATDLVQSLQSAAARADLISKFVTYFDDASLVNSQLARYQAVTATQVAEHLRSSLGDDNRLSLMYVPMTPSSAPEPSS
ncbi:MAG: pitrilysin family protein [Gemmatimonadaceae bacterium]